MNSTKNLHKPEDRKQLVEFSRIIAGFSLIICALSYYRNGELSLFAKTLALLALAIGLCGVFRPESLSGIYRKWILLGEKLAVIVSKAVVLVTFFAVVTPMSIVLKLLRKDLLGLKIDRASTETYFTKPDEAVATRHDAPF